MLIRDKKLKRALLNALANDEERTVLESTIGKSRSVVDIIRDCNLPHTSAYRLVNGLRERGLLIIERIVLARDGKKFALYRSAFRSMNVRFDHGDLEVDAEIDPGMSEKVFRIFYSLGDVKKEEAA